MSKMTGLVLGWLMFVRIFLFAAVRARVGATVLSVMAFIALLAVPLLVISAVPARTQDISGPARVIDGDTIVIDGQIIDLYGVDAPELDFNGVEQTCLSDGQTYRCALVAAGRLAEKIAGRTVSCEAHAKDTEGHLLASCYTEKREDLAGWLVNKGYVVVDSRYSEEFADWEIWNKAARTGLWSGQFELPWLWRAQNE